MCSFENKSKKSFGQVKVKHPKTGEQGYMYPNAWSVAANVRYFIKS